MRPPISEVRVRAEEFGPVQQLLYVFRTRQPFRPVFALPPLRSDRGEKVFEDPRWRDNPQHLHLPGAAVHDAMDHPFSDIDK